MKVNQVSAINNSIRNGHANKQPTFGADMVINKSLILYIQNDAVVNKRKTKVVENYWKKIFLNVANSIKPLKPYNANIQLNLKNTQGDMEIIGYFPHMSGIWIKPAGNIKSKKIEQQIKKSSFDVLDSMVKSFK